GIDGANAAKNEKGERHAGGATYHSYLEGVEPTRAKPRHTAYRPPTPAPVPMPPPRGLRRGRGRASEAHPERADVSTRKEFDCTDCPAFCCGLYEHIRVRPSDIKRLAKYFGISEEEAARRHTKEVWEGERT